MKCSHCEVYKRIKKALGWLNCRVLCLTISLSVCFHLDPCRGFSCPFGQLCQLDSARRPVCRCGEVCPMVFDPVCGSNGKTYANECLMREDSCRRQVDTRVIFQGECSSGKQIDLVTVLSVSCHRMHNAYVLYYTCTNCTGNRFLG